MPLISLTTYPVRDVLDILLQDKTTKKNIIFASNVFREHGLEFDEKSEITINKLSCLNLRARSEKAEEHQKNRTKEKAEVFTPSWLCNKMNNYFDIEWFQKVGVFNTEEENHWKINTNKVTFPAGRTWKDYVDSRRLEITCGEAPFVVSRYDTTTGDTIPIPDRIGFLDRKLRIINENTDNEKEWLKWTERAFQSVYGYEFQGDSLLIARINLLNTYVEYKQDRWGDKPDKKELKRIANIIAWNFWQMDGLTKTVPCFQAEEEYHQMSLFEMMGIEEKEEVKQPYCKIYDWRAKESIEFKSISTRG